MTEKNDFMELPANIVDTLQDDQLLLVVGGANGTMSVNNADGTCQGTNNLDGACTGTNNHDGRCSGKNNGEGVCQVTIVIKPSEPSGPTNG